MKLHLVAFVISIFTINGLAQVYHGSSFRTQSYYGFSGLSFLPNTQITSPGQLGISYSSKPSTGSEINLLPFSARICYGIRAGNLEAGLTNTPFYASERIYKGVSLTHGIGDFVLMLPVFPSVKYQLMTMNPSNYGVSMAIGFALPYGGYYVVDKLLTFGFFDLTLHTGVASKLTTYHVFTGITATIGNRVGTINRDFNLEMLVEAAWGGSLKQIDKKEESFLSLSFRHAWTSALYITTFIRYDNQPIVEDEEVISQGPTTRMGLGLDYHWQ